jgi:hypothetical protein
LQIRDAVVLAVQLQTCSLCNLGKHAVKRST